MQFTAEHLETPRIGQEINPYRATIFSVSSPMTGEETTLFISKLLPLFNQVKLVSIAEQPALSTPAALSYSAFSI